MNFKFISTKTGLNLKIILCLIFILKLQKILRTVSVPSQNSQLILPVWDTPAVLTCLVGTNMITKITETIMEYLDCLGAQVPSGK